MATTDPEEVTPIPTPEPVEPGAEPEPTEPPAEEPEAEQDLSDLTEPGDEEYSDRVRKRIGKSVAKQREAEREAERRREEAQYWRSQALAKQPEPAPREQPAPAGEPQEKDFETYEAYIRAVARYDAQQEFVKHEEARSRDQAAAALAMKMAKGSERWKDFNDLVYRPTAQGGPVVTQAMFEATSASDHAAEIAYWLATHREDSVRIGNMAPIGAAKEIGKLEAKAEAGTLFPKKPSTSNAPPPIPHRVTGTEAGTHRDPDKLPINQDPRMKEWIG